MLRDKLQRQTPPISTCLEMAQVLTNHAINQLSGLRPHVITMMVFVGEKRNSLLRIAHTSSFHMSLQLSAKSLFRI